MEITALGHAGFLVESGEVVLVADPWLSPEGAFDSGWMQLPRNHQLAPMVREKLSTDARQKFIYISHEHRDHFDPEFIASLPTRDVTVILGRFGRSALKDAIAALGFERIVVLDDGGKLPLPGGYARVWTVDQGVNRDSALLVRLGRYSFLDLNDCKIHDRLEQLVREEGRIDVFTAQFSGAIWHPTSYQYPRKTYEAISRRKLFSKFEAVARAIETLRPRRYLASAGPVAFLDPDLLHINFESVNIFPRAPRLFQYLSGRLKEATPTLGEPAPGDVLHVATDELEARGTERVTDETFEAYIHQYARDMSPVFEARRRTLSRDELLRRFEQLRAILQAKLDALTVSDRVLFPLYVAFRELPQRILRVDFAGRAIEEVPAIDTERAYVFIASAGDLVPVLERKMGWEEFLLSCRQQMRRTPDLYDAILHGYLALELEDLPSFCEQIRAAEAQKQRVEIEAGGRRYSIRRFCPHQGADLSQGWIQDNRYLVCPRHRWMFDLEDGGRCRANSVTCEALELPRRDELQLEAAEPVDSK